MLLAGSATYHLGIRKRRGHGLHSRRMGNRHGHRLLVGSDGNSLSYLFGNNVTECSSRPKAAGATAANTIIDQFPTIGSETADVFLFNCAPLDGTTCPVVRSPQWLRGKWWSLKRSVPNAGKLAFREICSYLYENYCPKMELQDEGATSSQTTLDELSQQHTKIVVPGAPLRILKAAAPPQMPGITTLPIGKFLFTFWYTVASGLTGTTLQPAAPLTLTTTTDGVLEVIPQNFQLPSAPPQAILLTTPGPGSIPIATLPPGQIIIQTLPTEPRQAAESVLVQMHLPPAVPPAELVVNSNTSLAPAEPSSPQPDTVSLDTSDVDSSSSYAMCCIDGEEFQVQEIHDTSCLGEVDDPSLVASQMSEHRAESVILSDPMLAGSPGLLGSSLDIDSDKSHVVDGLEDT
ncbi:hypothetical protein HPB51_002612 [Rhipicephalus microplus]|uniref:Uncharacterized protein n=1 Tax=Rhipicephalus microplus TaxID=6941 RepID=A0A9J6DEW2_RHIMP|nr:hypothetical protein HPB51_002612 [Rhipicephalus microplus]